jgi:hypothetical protein
MNKTKLNTTINQFQDIVSFIRKTYNMQTDFIPTALRFSTVYGLSPRISFDLTVNEFVRELAFDRELEIYGEQF